MALPPRAPKPLRVPSWYEEHLSGPLLPIIATAAAGLLVGSYTLGLISERVAALLFALVFLGACCFYAVKSFSESAPRGWEVGVAVTLGLATLALTFVPVVTALLPGSPVVQGTLAAPGDSILVPESGRGAVRILVHGVPAGHAAAHVQATLQVGDQRFDAHVERDLTQRRVGRRGRATVAMESDSEYVSVRIPSTVDRIVLDSIRGDLDGPLKISVFVERIPLRAELWAAGVLLVLAALIDVAFRGSGVGVGATACALVFGLVVSRVATPDVAVRQEIGALFVALLGGGLGGLVLSAVLRKTVQSVGKLRATR